MRGNRTREVLCDLFRCCVWFGCLAPFAAGAPAQTAGMHGGSGARTVQALFVSDIHFEPFWDPGKTGRLAVAPVSKWSAILGGPDSADREQRFAELEQTCHARGVDTSNTLFESSLRAMRAHAGDAKFVTVSGDLMAHSFSCKFATLFPKAAPGDYRAFAEKTLDYVMSELRRTLPGVPVYAALGNNDSDCGDYEIDANSKFLEASGKTLTADVPVAERAEALRTFATGGYYSVRLPAPARRARLLVLDDLFMSHGYATCSGKADRAPAAAEIAWLERRLSEARRNHEKVWVMAHIPPGVDPYSMAMRGLNLCNGGAPQMFLAAETLPDVLADYGDVIRLAIFGHTHMDEMRLLEPAKAGSAQTGVAVKMVASISPINGNNPSFTVARVDGATAMLEDYRVFAASNKTGVDTTWAEEYDFARTYKEPAYSASAVGRLVADFEADPAAQTSASQSYIRNYGTGMGARALSLFWHPYLCALKNDGADSFRACVCGK